MSEIDYQAKAAVKHTLALTRPELLEALKMEISRIEAVDKKPGWTIWALLGALAAIIWLLLKQLEAGNYNWVFAFHALMLISLGYQFWNDLLKALQIGNGRFLPKGRFWTMRILSNVRISILIHLVRYALLSVVAFRVAGHNMESILVLGYFGMLTLTTFLGFVFSYTKQTIPSFGDKMTTFALGSPLLFTTICGAAELAAMVHSPMPGFTSFRLGLLGAVGLIIIVLLTDEASPNPILQMLQAIQRDLLFSHITLEEALQQTDFALAGHHVDEVLQGELRPIFQKLDGLNLGLKESSEHLDTLEKLLAWKTEEAMLVESVRIIKSLIASVESRLESCRALTKTLEKDRKKLIERAKVIGFFDPSIQTELNGILERVATATEKNKEGLATVQSRLSTAKKKLEL